MIVIGSFVDRARNPITITTVTSGMRLYDGIPDAWRVLPGCMKDGFEDWNHLVGPGIE